MEVFNIKKKKWFILSIFFVSIAIVFFVGNKDNNRLNAMGNVLDSIPEIDSVVVNHGESDEQLMIITHLDPSFDKVVDIYNFYYDLNWSEKKLLKGNPFIKLDYIQENSVRFTINVYQVEDKNLSLLPEDIIVEGGTKSYSYLSEENDVTYIFVIEEINQLIDVTEGMKILLDKLILQY